MADDEKTVTIDLDYILNNYVGRYKKYQLITIFLLAFPIMFSATAQDYIFTISSLPHRCIIPECDGPTLEYTPEWLLNAVPGNSLSDFDQCNRYVNISIQQQPNGTTCPADLFNRDLTVSCDSYVYERTNSAVYDFGLECNEWLRALAGTLNSVGALLVLLWTGYISDKFGRRVAITINAFNTACFGLIRAFSVNYEMYLALQIIQTTFGAGAYSSCYILGAEMVGAKDRVWVGWFMSALFSVGQIYVGSMAWIIEPWRTLNIALYAPQLLCIFYYWILDDSVRWLISKKDYAKAEKTLQKQAKINGNEIPETALEVFFTKVRDETVAAEKNKELDGDQPSLFLQIVRSKVMLQRCCTTPVWWITTTLVYYGLSINAVGLAGNRFLNYILVSAIEIPGGFSSVIFCEKLGRRVTLSSAFCFCAACNIAFAFLPENLPIFSLVLYLLGKYSISIVFTSLYLYTAELYPTNSRHSLLGFSSMIGRVGSIVAPLTPALMVYWSGIPSIIFGSMALISGILVLTMPETLGTKLPDTIEEAEMLGNKL